VDGFTADGYSVPLRGAVEPYRGRQVQEQVSRAPMRSVAYDVPTAYMPPPPPSITAASQIRLIGDQKSLEAQIGALRAAGFQLVAENVRKTRDVGKKDLIYTATLIT
jgi:hypothetical protein